MVIEQALKQHCLCDEHKNIEATYEAVQFLFVYQKFMYSTE